MKYVLTASDGFVVLKRDGTERGTPTRRSRSGKATRRSIGVWETSQPLSPAATFSSDGNQSEHRSAEQAW